MLRVLHNEQFNDLFGSGGGGTGKKSVCSRISGINPHSASPLQPQRAGEAQGTRTK